MCCRCRAKFHASMLGPVRNGEHKPLTLNAASQGVGIDRSDREGEHVRPGIVTDGIEHAPTSCNSVKVQCGGDDADLTNERASDNFAAWGDNRGVAS